MDAEAAGRVVRRGDDAAPVRVAPNHERLAAELWLFELFDGREERVQVEVRKDR